MRAAAIAVRMSILLGGAAVGGPPGMANAVCSVQWMLLNYLFKLAQLAGSAAEFKGALMVHAHCDSSRVVAAILQAAQTLNND